MALVLKIEEQQKCALHSSLLLTLEVAAKMSSLDRAKEVLESGVSSGRWTVGRGGHHVWVSWNTVYGPVRVAMIEERS